MRRARGKGFAGDEGGSASIEYMILFLPLIALVMIAFQIALAYHFSLTAQKAVELGARVAAVRDPVARNMPAVNALDPASGLRDGDSCARGACVTPEGGPWTCSGESLGGVCDEAAFARIFDEVARIAYLPKPEDLSITYYYARLGLAGGPFAPIVEVKIRERPFFLQFFFNIAFGSGEDASSWLMLPSVAASAVAEDLSSTD